jgi:hypothetical protein
VEVPIIVSSQLHILYVHSSRGVSYMKYSNRVSSFSRSFLLLLCNSIDSNSNGSYYYSNDNGSTYYNSGTGYSSYTAPSGSSGGKK